MNYWLIKSEPGDYSWDDLKRDKKTYWDGVRNFQARNNLKKMEVGDRCLFYHSVNDKCVVGVAKVVKESYQDPTTDDDRWVVVDVAPDFELDKPVTLSIVKEDERLSEMVLVRNSRLSVQPVRAEEFDIVIGMGKNQEVLEEPKGLRFVINVKGLGLDVRYGGRFGIHGRGQSIK